jgi:hypothetical protein
MEFIQNIPMNDPLTLLITGILGVLILIAGRRLFWLTVAAIGFVVTLFFVLGLLEDLSPWVALIIALIAGVAGAVLAWFLQHVAIAVAGFLLSGYSALWLLQQLALDLGQWNWAVFIIVGVIGSFLSFYLFDIALIVLSSIAGSLMILQVAQYFFAPLSQWLLIVLFVVLVSLGLFIQTQGSTETRVRTVRVRRKGS